MTIISTGSCQNLCPNWTAVPLKTQPPTRRAPSPNIFLLLWPLQQNSLHLRGQKSRRKKRGENCFRFNLFGIKPQLSCFFLMPPLKTWRIASILGHFLPSSHFHCRKCSLTEVQPSAEKRSLKPQLSPKPVIRGRNGSENLPYRTTLNRAGLKPVTPSFVKHIGAEEKNPTGTNQTLHANTSLLNSTKSASPSYPNQASPKPAFSKPAVSTLSSGSISPNKPLSLSPKPSSVSSESISPKPVTSQLNPNRPTASPKPSTNGRPSPAPSNPSLRPGNLSRVFLSTLLRFMI